MANGGSEQLSTAELRTRTRRFVGELIEPSEGVLSGGGAPAAERLAELRQRARAEGLWALPCSREHGGKGLALADYAPIAIAEGHSEWSSAVFGSGVLLDCETLRWFARPAILERYFEPLIDGREFPSFSMTEPGVPGSDPQGLQTTATLEGETWVIRGRKWFTSNARRATCALVVCRTEPNAPAREAFSVFLVPSASPGYEIVRDIRVLGLNRDHCEIVYHDVRVPRDHLVGERGAGLAVCQKRLALGRTLRCLSWLGQAERAFDLMCRRLHARRLREGMLADSQLMQGHVFESYADITAARAQVMGLVNRFDSVPSILISTTKVATSRMLNRVVDRAIQVFGAEGLSDDCPLSTMFRLARSARIYDGPDEVHTEAVGRSLLKKCRDAPGPIDFQSLLGPLE